MSKWITDDGEVDRLNAFCAGKEVSRIECDGDYIDLYFKDGSSARLSTLGGIEIEKLNASEQKGGEA